MTYKTMIILTILASPLLSSACNSKDSEDSPKKVEDETLRSEWKLTEKASNGRVWTQFLYLSPERNFVQIFLANDEQSPAELMAEAEIDLLPAGGNSQDLLVKARKVILDQYQSNALPVIGNEEVRWAILQSDDNRMLLQVENKHPGLVFASEFGKSCARFNTCGGQVEFEAAKSGDVEANLKPDGFDHHAKVPVSPEHYYCDMSTNISSEELAVAKNGQWLTYDATGSTFKCRFVNPNFMPNI